jgi:hypothetical protein
MSLIEQYDYTYHKCSEMPVEAREVLEPRDCQALDRGKAKFLEPLKVGLPRLYEALIDDCGELAIVEDVRLDRMSLGGPRTRRAQTWALEAPGRIVVCGIKFVADAVLAPSLSAIPLFLRGLYANSDGMGICLSPAFHGVDLPASSSQWAALSDYCQERGVPRNELSAVREVMRSSQLRVLVYGSEGDVVLFDAGKEGGTLYIARSSDFASVEAIDDAQTKLDAYFADAVRGFPNRKRLCELV